MSKVKLKNKRDAEFGSKLKYLRKKQGITLVTLGKIIDVSYSYISMLESGDRQPSRDVVEKLAVALFPEGNDTVRDEMLVLAGFTPVNLPQLSKPSDMITRCEQALAEDRQDFKAFMSLLIALIKSRKYDSAKEKIQQGFQIFTHAVQWQALFSIQELIRGNYEAAIISQQTAIDYYNLPENQELAGVSLTDLLKNLGIIHFLKGSEHLANSIESESSTDESASALQNFYLARDKFEQALQIAPGNIYVLDEYARLNFNLAFMAKDTKEADSLWKKTIQTFKDVLFSEKKEELGADYILEAGVFLAHAYTKSGNFEQAELAINLIMAGVPNYWLNHYVKACFYNLKYEHDGRETWLDKGLDSLKKALKSESQGNTAMVDARQDPDLQAIRQQRSQAFVALLQGITNE